MQYTVANVDLIETYFSTVKSKKKSPTLLLNNVQKQTKHQNAKVNFLLQRKYIKSTHKMITSEMQQDFLFKPNG